MRPLQSKRLLRKSGADGTILRSSWLCQNFSENFLIEELLKGEIALPASAVAEVPAEMVALLTYLFTTVLDGGLTFCRLCACASRYRRLGPSEITGAGSLIVPLLFKTEF